jgi:hypothetical protein
VDDFEALTDVQRGRLVSPYYCCLQDVLWGFAVMTWDEDPLIEMHVTGDQRQGHEDMATNLYRALRRIGGLFGNLAHELTFADMRQTFGLQAADLLAYEMVKELKNQDTRPADRMRWPLDQILGTPESPHGKMLKYTTAEMLRTQASGEWNARKRDVLATSFDESVRILRDKSDAFKLRFWTPNKRP